VLSEQQPADEVAAPSGSGVAGREATSSNALDAASCTRSLAEWSECFAEQSLRVARCPPKLEPLPQTPRSSALLGAEACSCGAGLLDTSASRALASTETRILPAVGVNAKAQLSVSAGQSEAAGSGRVSEAEEYEEDFEEDSDEEPDGHEGDAVAGEGLTVEQTLRRSSSATDQQHGVVGVCPSGKEADLVELEQTVAKLRIEVAEMGSANDEANTLSSTLKEVASRLSPMGYRPNGAAPFGPRLT